MNLERQTDLAQGKSSAVELLGGSNTPVVQRWISTTSSGAVEMVEDRRPMDLEFVSQHAHWSTTVVASE